MEGMPENPASRSKVIRFPTISTLNNAQSYTSARPALQVGESGEYGELAGRPLPKGFLLVFVPSLAALLTRAQQLSGAALTEDQVLRIRNGSKVMVVRHDAARAVEEQRGYADMDAADAWQSWLRLQEAQA
jgi:hypothetical protein